MFLAQPEVAREAIQLAVKLSREGRLTQRQAGASGGGAGGAAQLKAPAAQSMPAAAAGGSTLRARLAALESLAARGVLSPEQSAAVRVGVMSADTDPTVRLLEAAALADEGLISAAELGALAERFVTANAVAAGGGAPRW